MYNISDDYKRTMNMPTQLFSEHDHQSHDFYSTIKSVNSFILSLFWTAVAMK